ncbi:MAG: acyloxyacyl hydrolase [Bacteroidota bacterium]|nr:acyloxyacyl hydrolase [Bacteroidota bacterium]
MKIYLLIFTILLNIVGLSQVITKEADKNQNIIASGTYGYGNVIPTNPFVKGDNLQESPIEHYQFLALKVLWQNPGYTDWQKVYKGPYYGFGVTMGDFYNPQEIGYPISSYGILGVPIKRWRKIEVFTEFQFGLTSNWVHYDSITNPKNIVIGGGLTVHLDIAMKLFYNLSPNFDLGAGVGFIHFSNGGFERPNRGFNIYSPFAELRYRINKRPNYKSIAKADRLERSNDLYFMMGYGDHQLVEHELDTNYFAIGGLSAIYFHQFSNAFRLGAGTDFNYWWGLNANPDGTIGARTWENLTIGLLLQPEMIIDKLTIVGGIGIYARHLHYGEFNQTYQRLGIRYDVYENISVGVNVRAVNFMLAEFLEFNLGYRIRWMK